MNNKDLVDLTDQEVEAFRNAFGVDVADYWEFIDGNDVGLDIIKLDEEIIHSGDDSMHNAISKKYGPEIADMLGDWLEPR